MVLVQFDEKENARFELSYMQKDYIALKYFNEYPGLEEIHFLFDLLQRDPQIQYRGKKVMIWSMHFLYQLQGTNFTMILDEDYGTVCFYVEGNDLTQYEYVARHIARLVESQQIPSARLIN